MEQIGTLIANSVREMPRITNRGITCVNLDIPQEVISAMLITNYAMLTRERGAKFEMTKEFQSNVNIVAKFLSGNHDKLWLILAGTYGCGKTTLLKAIERTIIQSHADDYYTRIRTATEFVNSSSDKTLQNLIMRSRLIMLDEVGVEPQSIQTYGNVSYPFEELLMYRYEHMLPIIMATNLSGEDFKNRYSPRIYDRLLEMQTSVVFTNKSYR